MAQRIKAVKYLECSALTQARRPGSAGTTGSTRWEAGEGGLPAGARAVLRCCSGRAAAQRASAGLPASSLGCRANDGAGIDRLTLDR